MRRSLARGRASQREAAHTKHAVRRAVDLDEHARAKVVARDGHTRHLRAAAAGACHACTEQPAAWAERAHLQVSTARLGRGGAARSARRPVESATRAVTQRARLSQPAGGACAHTRGTPALLMLRERRTRLPQAAARCRTWERQRRALAERWRRRAPWAACLTLTGSRCAVREGARGMVT